MAGHIKSTVRKRRDELRSTPVLLFILSRIVAEGHGASHRGEAFPPQYDKDNPPQIGPESRLPGDPTVY